MLYVGIGGALGAVSRYVLGKWIMDRATTVFPLGTWFINISGSFVLGIVSYLYLHGHVNEQLWLLISIGFLGSYTTFSTFGYEALQLFKQREMERAILYVLSSVIFSIVFAYIGVLLGTYMI